MSDTRCFFCRCDVVGGKPVPGAEGATGKLKDCVMCGKCEKTLEDSVAMLSVSDDSLRDQARAVAVHYDRRSQGQMTPFPSMYVRTGLTVFVIPEYAEEYFTREAVSGKFTDMATKLVRKFHWMYMPDSAVDEEGLTRTCSPEVLAGWKAQREEANRE